MPDLVDIMIELAPTNTWRIIDGVLFWEDEEYLKPTEEQIQSKKEEINSNYPMKVLREKRNSKLLETDKYVINDWPHKTEDIKKAWLFYREQLRDLPLLSNPQIENGNLINVDWPTPPISL